MLPICPPFVARRAPSPVETGQPSGLMQVDGTGVFGYICKYQMPTVVSRALKRKARVIKALAHPSRLAMVEALAAGERCVCELQVLVGLDMSTVSRHLSVLKNAGIVCARKHKQWVYYRLCAPHLAHFLKYIEALAEGEGEGVSEREQCPTEAALQDDPRCD